jgi:hypothetical protein
MLFKDLEEFYKKVEEVSKFEPTKENVDYLKNFLRFSPNRFARKLGIDEIEFQKKFNSLKPKLGKKLTYMRNVLKLSKYSPTPKILEAYIYENDILNIKEVSTTVCICKKDFRIDKRIHFYKGINYLYAKTFKDIKEYMVFDEDERINIELNKKTFLEHFVDAREFKINQILKDDNS